MAKFKMYTKIKCTSLNTSHAYHSSKGGSHEFDLLSSGYDKVSQRTHYHSSRGWFMHVRRVQNLSRHSEVPMYSCLSFTNIKLSFLFVCALVKCSLVTQEAAKSLTSRRLHYFASFFIRLIIINYLQDFQHYLNLILRWGWFFLLKMPLIAIRA